MTDKKRFLNEVKEVKLIIQANRAQGAFSEGYLIGQESVLEHFEKFIDSLQEEPVSEDLEEAARNYGDELDSVLCACEDDDSSTGDYATEAFKAGAKRQKEKLMAKAIDGDITFDYYGDDDKTYGCIAQDSFCLEDFGLKDRDKVKVIVIKED